MANLKKIVIGWSGQTGLPGVSVMYTATADDVTTNLATFFTAIRTAFPPGTTWAIPGNGDLIDETTGQLVGDWTGGTAATVTSTRAAVGYAAGIGLYIRWGTSAIVGHRRLKGRTFFTGVGVDVYDTDGTLTAPYITQFQNAANTLVASNKLRVWHRPPKGGSSGAAYLVSSATIPDRVTDLKSRKI